MGCSATSCRSEHSAFGTSFTSSLPSTPIRTLRAVRTPDSAACCSITCPRSSCIGRPTEPDPLWCCQPKASKFGTEKWQAGVGGVTIDATKWGLLGGLFTYQHAFGRGTGAITQETTFQPFIHYNFHHGLYLRSTGLLVSTPAPGLKPFPWAWASARYGTLPTARLSTSTWSPSIRCGEADLGLRIGSSSPGSTSSFPSTFKSGAGKRGTDHQSLKGMSFIP
jgi:hypothetical protein